MPLKITKADQPIQVENITLALYGQPGLGKTSTGFTAESPLLIDFDQGAYRSAFRRDSVQVSTWADVASITEEDFTPYSTVVVDTVGRALDALTADIIRREPKLGWGGALTLQGYGQLKARFIAWLTLVRGYGKDVALLAHSDEQRKGEETVERLDVQGGSKNEIYKCADAMGRLSIVSGKRVLNFNPTDATFGKNPAGFDPLPVPDFGLSPDFLADVICRIKERLNAESEAALKEHARLDEYVEYLAGLDGVAELNKEVKKLKAKGAEPKIKALLLRAGTERGLAFDKKAGAFVDPSTPSPTDGGGETAETELF
jgi:hypothetical protein